MTFAEKKIQKFHIEFCVFHPPTKKYLVSSDIEIKRIENWLKQTLADAEREGQKKAYYELKGVIVSSQKMPPEFGSLESYCLRKLDKLKELEGE